jgi:hypothetical protein
VVAVDQMGEVRLVVGATEIAGFDVHPSIPCSLALRDLKNHLLVAEREVERPEPGELIEEL